MKHIFAPKAAIQTFKNCTRRFPLPSAFVTLLTAVLVVHNAYTLLNRTWISDHLYQSLLFYFSVGFLLTLVLKLWSEDRGIRQRTLLIVNCVAHLLLIAETIYFYTTLRYGSIEMNAAFIAAMLALLVSLFFLPIKHEQDDVSAWNFTKNILSNAFLCFAVGQVMAVGISLLFIIINMLFETNIDWWPWIVITENIFGLLLSSILFLGRIPQSEQKYIRQAHETNFFCFIMRKQMKECLPKPMFVPFSNGKYCLAITSFDWTEDSEGSLSIHGMLFAR